MRSLRKRKTWLSIPVDFSIHLYNKIHFFLILDMGYAIIDLSRMFFDSEMQVRIIVLLHNAVLKRKQPSCSYLVRTVSDLTLDKEITMEENKQKKASLFREQSLEAIESPEKLNDYLRVTSPGVWLILAACIVLLMGFVLWGIFGSIDTTVKLAVTASNGRTLCYVPYNELERVAERGEVNLNGKNYPLRAGTDAKVVVVSEEMDPYVRVGGDLAIGDVTVELELDADLPDGVYSATVVTERLKPVALLLQ